MREIQQGMGAAAPANATTVEKEVGIKYTRLGDKLPNGLIHNNNRIEYER